MSWIDIAIVVIIVLSMALSLYRGFVREAVSLATWVGASWLAVRFADPLAARLPDALESVSFKLAGTDFDIDNMRIDVAFVIIFIGTLIAGTILNHLLSRLIQGRILKASDRVLGLVFGFAKGALVVLVIVLAAGLTGYPRTPAWRRAQLLPPFERGAVWVQQQLPPRYAGYFSFDKQ